MVLNFKEPETIQTPDGQTYEILPLPVKDMPLLLDFMDLQEKLNLSDEATAEKKAKDNIELLLPPMSKMVVSSVKNKETGEPIPEKYLTLKNYIELATKVIIATSDSPEDKPAGDNPLEQKNTKQVKKSSG